jgi:integrase/recombinase XerD
MLACQTGLRATEHTQLSISDVHLGAGPHVSCLGKGRKQRITPLTTATVAVLRAWLTERSGGPADPLFPTRHGTAMTLDALQRRVSTHAITAALSCPSLQEKTITPHVLRHSCAMALLRSGIDISVIALRMGHENLATVQHYIHADLALKEQALARTKPKDAPPGRYQPPDTVLAFLDSPTIMPTSPS